MRLVLPDNMMCMVQDAETKSYIFIGAYRHLESVISGMTPTDVRPVVVRLRYQTKHMIKFVGVLSNDVIILVDLEEDDESK